MPVSLDARAWKQVQEDAPPVEYRWAPVLYQLTDAIQLHGRQDATDAAGLRAFELFPWDLGADGWQGTGINPKVCTDCALIAVKALVMRDVLPTDAFVSLYGPFHRVVPHPYGERPLG